MTIFRLGPVFVADLEATFDLVILVEDNGTFHRVYDGAALSDDDFHNWEHFEYE